MRLLFCCVTFFVFFSTQSYAYRLGVSMDSSIIDKNPEFSPSIQGYGNYKVTTELNKRGKSSWSYKIYNDDIYAAVIVDITPPLTSYVAPIVVFAPYHSDSSTDISFVKVSNKIHATITGNKYKNKVVMGNDTCLDMLVFYYQELTACYKNITNYIPLSKLGTQTPTEQEIVVVFKYIQAVNFLATKLIYSASPDDVSLACNWLSEAKNQHTKIVKSALGYKYNDHINCLLREKNAHKSTLLSAIWNKLIRVNIPSKTKVTLMKELYDYVSTNVTDAEYKTINTIYKDGTSVQINGIKRHIILSGYARELRRLIETASAKINTPKEMYDVSTPEMANQISWLFDNAGQLIEDSTEPEVDKSLNSDMAWFKENTNINICPGRL